MAEQTILIAEDDPDIRDGVRILLSGEGYHIIEAENGTRALEVFRPEVDLVILDIMMPGMSGLRVCEELRKLSTVPILFLTAKIEDADKVKGFASGGDDYILKPFSSAELLARVAAHLRREERRQSEVKVKFDRGLVIDYTQRCVFQDGEPVKLAKKEFEIVELLSTHPSQVFDRERIYEAIWGYEGEGDSAVVAEHIRRIRAKLTAASCGERIETVWGVGYKWKK